MPYYDMDKEIVKIQKRTIPEIFEQEGEAYFRQLETEFLAKLSETNPALFQRVAVLQ